MLDFEWTDDGYPTGDSIRRLRKALRSKNLEEVIDAFYDALAQNYYGEDGCGPERVEVRGEVIDVWGYHTGGWSGNEEILATLEQEVPVIWMMALERYDSGGHFYFRPREQLMARFDRSSRSEEAGCCG